MKSVKIVLALSMMLFGNQVFAITASEAAGAGAEFVIYVKRAEKNLKDMQVALAKTEVDVKNFEEEEKASLERQIKLEADPIKKAQAAIGYLRFASEPASNAKKVLKVLDEKMLAPIFEMILPLFPDLAKFNVTLKTSQGSVEIDLKEALETFFAFLEEYPSMVEEKLDIIETNLRIATAAPAVEEVVTPAPVVAPQPVAKPAPAKAPAKASAKKTPAKKR
ncbi:MAG TPA: hypothetical protein VFF04_00060 [Candidatus Babeliales bacterium]|nr:hypothetical protein [Candidatus Babeliales bacterium]